MQTECTPKLFEFEAVERRKVVAGFDGGDITSNAGALLLRQADHGLGLMRRFAECFIDRRDPRYIEHTVETLVGQRVFGLALGYEDLNDHDELRWDPTFAVLAGKLKAIRADCAPVAGKSTLNRLEHTPKRNAEKYHKIDYDPAQIEALFVDLFIEAHTKAPRRIVLDLDPTDLPLYGGQDGRFFHGYYDNYCYLPLYVFCGRHLLGCKLRCANTDACAGAVEEMSRIIGQIRQAWPRVRITLRADSTFAREELMHWCEENRVDYVFGLARNSRLVAELAKPLAQAAQLFAQTGKPARVFREFRYRTVDSWSRRRRVIGKSLPSRKRGPSTPRRVPTPGLSSPRCHASTLPPGRCTRISIARAARRRTGSASSSSCSPTASPRRRCQQTSYGCGFRAWPMFWSTTCVGSPCGTRNLSMRRSRRSA